MCWQVGMCWLQFSSQCEMCLYTLQITHVKIATFFTVKCQVCAWVKSENLNLKKIKVPTQPSLFVLHEYLGKVPCLKLYLGSQTDRNSASRILGERNWVKSKLYTTLYYFIRMQSWIFSLDVKRNVLLDEKLKMDAKSKKTDCSQHAFQPLILAQPRIGINDRALSYSQHISS